MASSSSSFPQDQLKFFESEHYAVVGANNDRNRFGNIIFRWYKDRDIKCTPIHPSEPEIEGIPAVPSILNLPSSKVSPTIPLSQTSLSFVTPPPVTLKILQIAFDSSSNSDSDSANLPPAIWLQPGCEDEKVWEFVKKMKATGDDGDRVRPRVILGGPCVLVSGDGLREEVRKRREKDGGKL